RAAGGMKKRTAHRGVRRSDLVHALPRGRGRDSNLARLRRVAALACYWSGEDLIAHNYQTRVRTPAPPLAIEILDFCGGWRTLDEVYAQFSSYPRVPLRRLIRILVERTLLDRSVAADPPSSSGQRAPCAVCIAEAACCHFCTKAR